jgi:hypothetical protein
VSEHRVGGQGGWQQQDPGGYMQCVSMWLSHVEQQLRWGWGSTSSTCMQTRLLSYPKW